MARATCPLHPTLTAEQNTLTDGVTLQIHDYCAWAPRLVVYAGASEPFAFVRLPWIPISKGRSRTGAVQESRHGDTSLCFSFYFCFLTKEISSFQEKHKRLVSK